MTEWVIDPIKQCHHEAGHAVVALAQGLRVARLTTEIVTAEEDEIVGIAGEVAVQLLENEGSEAICLSRPFDCKTRHRVEPYPVLLCARILLSYWSLVKQLADMLLDKSEIKEIELYELWERKALNPADVNVRVRVLV